MDKRFIPVAMLAGALALAGCGGGSNTTAGGTEPPTCDDDEMLVGSECVAKVVDEEDDEDNDPTPATLSGTGLTNTTGEAYVIRLEKDETHDAPKGKITCPTEECIITVGAQRGTPVVTATGGATFATTEQVAERERPRVNADGNTGETDGNWLSKTALIRAVKSNPTEIRPIRQNVELTLSDGTDTTIAPGTYAADAAPTGVEVGTITVDAGGGRETDLRLSHTRGRTAANLPDQNLPNEYLVYGTWETRTRTGDRDVDPVSAPAAGAVWSGTIPRTDPQAWGTGSAHYRGLVLGHYKQQGQKIEATDPWIEWNGTVDLRANFAPRERNILGTIQPSAVTGQGDANDDNTFNVLDGARGFDTIHLRQTKIGASMSGFTRIDTDPSNGEWNAGFYGTATGGEPGGIAGDFKANRAHTTAYDALEIQGAFGAHNVDDLQSLLHNYRGSGGLGQPPARPPGFRRRTPGSPGRSGGPRCGGMSRILALRAPSAHGRARRPVPGRRRRRPALPLAGRQIVSRISR